VTAAQEKTEANAIKVNTSDLYELREPNSTSHTQRQYRWHGGLTYQEATKVLGFVGDQIRTGHTEGWQSSRSIDSRSCQRSIRAKPSYTRSQRWPAS